MSDQLLRKSIKEISPIDVYRLLPRTNCCECGEANCMAFATRLVNGEYVVADCPPLLTQEFQGIYLEICDLLRPPVRAVTFGTGDHAITIGGKHVVYRHDFTYHNPTAIAIDVTDSTPHADLVKRVKAIESFSYQYIGRTLTLDAIAVRSTSGDPGSFAKAVGTVSENSLYPLILCTHDPKVMAAGIEGVKERRPLLYAATGKNWKEMAELAILNSCPVVVSAPGNIALLRSLAKTMTEYEIPDIVLDPGTLTDSGLARTITDFSMIRQAACVSRDEMLGFPLVGTPISAWAGVELSIEAVQWTEAYVASMLISRYADLLIMHGLEGWALLPQLIWRFNLYTDPRKPVSVDAGVRSFGDPDKGSPLLITTNYALTYFTVESDIKSAHLDCHLIVVDTSGISVESAVAGRYLTAESITAALNEYNAASLVDHRYLIIPGLAARLSGDTEEASGWRVIVGPKDSSGLSQYLRDHWPPKSDE